MASGKDNTFSCCSICLDDGRNTVARHYCVDCETYFCTRCVKCHKLPSLKTHQVNEVNTTDSDVVDDDDTSIQSKVQHESTSSLRCKSHHGRVKDSYCKDHDKVCCGACAMVKHRSCTTALISIVAKDFKSSTDMKKFKEALTENLVQCKQEKQKRGDSLDGIGKQKVEAIENVDKYEEEIIAKIKELADIMRKEIRYIYEGHKTVLETDIEALNVVIAANTECVNKLEHMDDKQLFVHAKTNKTLTKDGEMLLEALTKDWKERGIQFCLDETLKKQVFGMKSLGQLEDKIENQVTEYRATFQSNVNVGQNHDSVSYVHDLCFLDAKDLLLADYSNKKLKRFNSNLQFKDEIALSGYPVAVCEIDKHEVAVRFRKTNVVQFVSVGQSMQLTSSFTLAGNGYGMMYDADTWEIFACEGNKVNVYSKTGNKLRTYDKDTNGDQLFQGCRQIALSENKQHIYVTDGKRCLVVLDKSGTFKMKVSLSGVSNAWPLSLLPGGICLVGHFTSGVIVQVDKNGKQVGTLIDTNNGRTYTYCAVYDREHSRLIVGAYPGVISVYTLSAQ